MTPLPASHPFINVLCVSPWITLLLLLYVATDPNSVINSPVGRSGSIGSINSTSSVPSQPSPTVNVPTPSNPLSYQHSPAQGASGAPNTSSTMAGYQSQQQQQQAGQYPFTFPPVSFKAFVFCVYSMSHPPLFLFLFCINSLQLTLDLVDIRIHLPPIPDK